MANMIYPTEVTALRSRFEKHFEVAPGEFEAKSFRVPVHYEHEGEWLDIRPRWIRTADGFTLAGVPYEGRIRGRTIGCDSIQLLGYEGTPDVRGHRVWWHAIAPDTSAVLIASATGLQLHLVLWGPNAPNSFVFWDEDVDAGPSGRDNIELYVTRDGPEQHFELDVSREHLCAEILQVKEKRWSGRIKSIDPVTRKKRWSDDVAYPVRIT